MLWQKLLAFEKAKGSQLPFITAHHCARKIFSAIRKRAAETYKPGRKGVGDGVLVGGRE